MPGTTTKINNIKEKDLMNSAGAIMQNQVFRYDNRIYAIRYGYLHVFDTDLVKWTGMSIVHKKIEAVEEQPDDYM